jgi:CheY-like chemotaxis protein
LTIEKNGIIYLQQPLVGKKVLFVEDNAINQKVTRKLLEKLGCEAEIAQDGATALRVIQGQDFDFFLLDLNLPDLSGFDIAKKIREMGIIVPIIAYSGDDAPQTSDKCLESGMDDLLLKPQKDAVEMGLRICEILEKRKIQKLYNFDSLIKMGFDNNEILGFVNDFLESVPIAIENLSNAFIKNDMNLLYRTAHNLKTTSLNFGIHSVRANLIAVESFAKNLSLKEQNLENESFLIIDQVKNTEIESVNAELLIKNVINVLSEVSRQLEKYLKDGNYVKKN